MRKPQYVILYRDSPKTRSYVFGPFVTQTIADEFKDTLPEPLEGGYKIRKHTEPQTYHEAQLVAFELVKQRRKNQTIN